jgi:tRNA U38,U39,U40 pseudouridine synthase TruA
MPRDRPVRRTIERFRVRRADGGLLLEISGRSFVWGMVRKIVAAVREVESGRLASATLAAALRGEVELTLPMAEPEPLVLWEVDYPIRWEHFAAAPTRGQVRRNSAEEARLWARAKVLDAINRPAPSLRSGD